MQQTHSCDNNIDKKLNAEEENEEKQRERENKKKLREERYV